MHSQKDELTFSTSIPTCLDFTKCALMEYAPTAFWATKSNIGFLALLCNVIENFTFSGDLIFVSIKDC